MPGQKEQVYSVSLIRQIENGLARGYKESEIWKQLSERFPSGIQLRS